jgi:hypothetical protein
MEVGGFEWESICMSQQAATEASTNAVDLWNELRAKDGGIQCRNDEEIARHTKEIVGRLAESRPKPTQEEVDGSVAAGQSYLAIKLE